MQCLDSKAVIRRQLVIGIFAVLVAGMIGLTAMLVIAWFLLRPPPPSGEIMIVSGEVKYVGIDNQHILAGFGGPTDVTLVVVLAQDAGDEVVCFFPLGPPEQTFGIKVGQTRSIRGHVNRHHDGSITALVECELTGVN